MRNQQRDRVTELRGVGRIHGEDADHADHAGDREHAAEDHAALLGVFKKRVDEDAERGGAQHRSEGRQRHGQRVSPFDPEDQPCGGEQDCHLRRHGQEDGHKLAAQDGRLRSRRGEQARQGALFLLLEDALRGGRAGVEGIENHHPAHDGTDYAEQKVIAFRGRITRTVGRGAHVQKFAFDVLGLRQRDFQIALDDLACEILLLRGGLVEENVDRDLHARHPVHEAVEDGAEDARPDRQRRVLVELDNGLPLQVRELLREIFRDDDGDFGGLTVHGGARRFGVRGARDLDQVRHFVALEDADD